MQGDPHNLKKYYVHMEVQINFADEGLPNLGLCSAHTAFDKEGDITVTYMYLLSHGPTGLNMQFNPNEPYQLSRFLPQTRGTPPINTK